VFGPGAWFHVLLALKATLEFSALLNRAVRFNIIKGIFGDHKHWVGLGGLIIKRYELLSKAANMGERLL
jgi:hypothetical protein